MNRYVTKETAPSISKALFDSANNPDILLDKTFSGVSSMRDKMGRFAKNKGAVFGATFIVLLTLLSIFGPMLSGYTYDFIDLTHMNLPPRIQNLEKLGIFNGVEKGSLSTAGRLKTSIIGSAPTPLAAIFSPASARAPRFHSSSASPRPSLT